jgi:hypothetical protein
MSKNSTITDRKKRVLLRDWFTCMYCLRRPKRHYITVDHVLPKRLGGTNEQTNLVTSCLECNTVKGCSFSEEHQDICRKLRQMNSDKTLYINLSNEEVNFLVDAYFALQDRRTELIKKVEYKV